MALFHVRMDVDIPRDLDPDVRAETVAKEKAYSQDLQRQGKWREIWRIVGPYSHNSIFHVASADELHEILWDLPLFPHINIQVLPLTQHGSAIK